MGLIVYDNKLLRVGSAMATSTDCCCESDNPCNYCDGGYGPSQFTVTLPDMESLRGNCYDNIDCSTLSGQTYILDRFSSCIWQYRFPSGICESSQWIYEYSYAYWLLKSLFLRTYSTKILLAASTGIGTGNTYDEWAYWESETLTASIDCFNISNLNLNYQGRAGGTAYRLVACIPDPAGDTSAQVTAL